MRNQQEKSPASVIAISAFITLLVLGACTYLFFVYGLPILPFSLATIYSVLLRLLPILIGLILVLIALVIQPPPVPKDSDDEDEIEKDAFIRPLYNLPDEEDTPLYARAQLPVAQPEKSITEVNDNRLPDPAPEITSFSGVVPAPVEHSVRQQTYKESYTRSVVEPSPVESTQSAELLNRAVLFNDYPFPIEPGSSIAELLEPIEATIIDGNLTEADVQVIDDTFESRLESEIESAAALQYEISVAIIDLPASHTETHSVDASIVQDLYNKLGIVSYFYLTEELRVSAILPFHGFNQCRRYFASLLDSLRKQHPEAVLSIGFSSSRSREITGQELLQEAVVAADLAAERTGFSLIGYDTDLEVEDTSEINPLTE